MKPYVAFVAFINNIARVCFQIEGPQLLQHGFKDAIAKVGLQKFLSDLFWIGMFYHLYNQVPVYMISFRRVWSLDEGNCPQLFFPFFQLGLSLFILCFLEGLTLLKAVK